MGDRLAAMETVLQFLMDVGGGGSSIALTGRFLSRQLCDLTQLYKDLRLFVAHVIENLHDDDDDDGGGGGYIVLRNAAPILTLAKLRRVVGILCRTQSAIIYGKEPTFL